MTFQQRFIKPLPTSDLGTPLDEKEFAAIIDDAINQPPWRTTADKEMDYAAGNQLSTELMERLKRIGIPPAKENMIGQTMRAVCGYEAKTRTDWRVTPNGDPEGQDVADALNFRLNQAERLSRADWAMSQAFLPQVGVGLGWVEVYKSQNPFEFKYKCRYVNRNEVHWDMSSSDADIDPALPESQWLFREKFVKRQVLERTFPQKAEQIQRLRDTYGMGGYGAGLVEGGVSTGLMSSMDAARAMSRKEQAWYRPESDMAAVMELWYRRWVTVMVLTLRNGRAVEFDEANEGHRTALMSGFGELTRATIPRMRRSFWMGPVPLHDEPSPHPHPYFGFVPFFGYREDSTGVPYGLIRDMIFPQDNLNSTIAKLRWGMASVRTERTKGAVAMTDAQLRQQIARPDADIILNADHMAQPGARFEVTRDFQLNAQQFQLMDDSRRALERVSPSSAAFQGRQGTATSGLQEQTQVEQSETGLATLMDNFKASRTLVGQMLAAMIVDDMGHEEQTIIIEGDTLNPPRTVVLNKPEIDPETGLQYLSNDVQRTLTQVALEDVPSSSSFRAQQLNVLSEACKSLPPDIQKVVLPFLIDLMDLPRKKQVVEAIQAAGGQADPEAIKKQVEHDLMYDLKQREIELKERKGEAEIRATMAQAVQTGVQAAFSAMQAGAQVATMPQIAPIADVVMQGAGYQRPNPMGDDPNFPAPAGVPVPAAGEGAPLVHQNTSPTFPPVPSHGASPMTGIETASPADNLPPG